MGEARRYRNPVLSGFFPDPSILRVGEDYYLANSTFEHFPAIAISHSRDLVHWEIIGHAVTRGDYLDMTGIEDSHGFWAPDISYHDGVFYIFATLRLNGGAEEAGRSVIRRQMIVRSDRPEGPYSRPLFIDIDGIDPSHFVDDDGAHYMVLHPGARLVRLNDDCTASMGGPVTIWPGTGARCPEGPHVMKKDGWYYVILAEGGTGYGHMVSVARSRKLHGPYEPSPYNPVLTQPDPKARIQRAGHGKLVQTQTGEWWMFYLCGRPLPGNYCILGRETALDPVRWTGDGWFLVNEGKGPSESQAAPDLPEKVFPESRFDDFNDSKLAKVWQFVRNPDNEAWSLAERPGWLRIRPGHAGPEELAARNILVRREQHHRYSARLKLEFVPDCPGQEAGLICRYNRRCFIKLCLTCANGLRIRLSENRNDVQTTLAEAPALSDRPVYLKVAVDGLRREFFLSYDDQEWTPVGTVADASFLSDEGVTIGKHHTGTMVGLYATNGGTGSRPAADFDWFAYEPGEG